MSTENKELTPDISAMLDEAYNMGVDLCIQTVELYNTGKEFSPLIITLLSKLNALKK